MVVRRRGGPARVVPLGETCGLDMERVFLESLAPGWYAVSVWRGGRHTFLISDGVAHGLIASIARHAFERHSPDWHDESWTIEVCDVADCPEARAWATSPVGCIDTASGL